MQIRIGRPAAALAVLLACAAVPGHGQGSRPAGRTYRPVTKSYRTVTRGTQPASQSSWKDPAAFATEIFRLTNVERTRRGLPAFRRDSRLDQAAAQYSRYMGQAGFFSHVGPNGVRMDRRISAAGYRWQSAGENIGMGYQNPQQAVNGWMGSSGHRANILNPRFKDIGVGVAMARGSTYATQNFGTQLAR